MTLLTMIVKMGEGLSKTCAIFSLTLLFSLPLGMVVALLRMSKNWLVSNVTRFFISILRGTPLMLQLLAVTYGPYYIWEVPVARNKLIPVVIAFAINYAAYFAEIYRGGIESMPVGQYEAAEVLGYTKTQTFIHIILPQAFRRMLPPLGNNAIAILKDSSLVSAIGLAELAYAARTVAGATARYWEPYITISLMYWVMTLGLAYLVKKMEQRLGKGDDNR